MKSASVTITSLASTAWAGIVVDCFCLLLVVGADLESSKKLKVLSIVICGPPLRSPRDMGPVRVAARRALFFLQKSRGEAAACPQGLFFSPRKVGVRPWRDCRVFSPRK